MSSHYFTRRDFIRGGTVSGVCAGMTSVTQAHTETKVKSRSEFLKTGIILGGGNHSQNMWARLINAVPDVNNIPYTPRRTGMEITHVWAVIPGWAETFADTFGVKNVVKRFDDMIGEVDGLFIDAFFGTPYYYHLAKPYIEANVPLFINRPLADSVGKAKDITQLAKKHNTPIMTGSSFEFLESTMSVKNRYPFNTVKDFDSYNATSDFYSHGVHGLLFTYACVGGNMEAVGHRTKSWIQGGGITDVVYKDRGDGPFMGKIHDYSTEKYLCAIKFRDSDQYYGFGQSDWDQFMWIHMLQQAEIMFETGLMPHTHEQIVEKTAMFVAAFYSILRENGDLVGLDDFDEDWEIGVPWGHSGNPSIEEQDGYRKLFGEEKGELRPDRTMG
ncbi:MAG: Gfo/Idh/MocA family oxidoreductase [Candidatus Latescibacteria bacterium]|nr:Gfo/Idh/MocA family oxidoreductase [Candidatus Latescibacterota bacterium]